MDIQHFDSRLKMKDFLTQMSSAPVNFYIEILIKVIKIVVFEENEIKDQVELKFFCFCLHYRTIGVPLQGMKTVCFQSKSWFQGKNWEWNIHGEKSNLQLRWKKRICITVGKKFNNFFGSLGQVRLWCNDQRIFFVHISFSRETTSLHTVLEEIRAKFTEKWMLVHRLTEFQKHNLKYSNYHNFTPKTGKNHFRNAFSTHIFNFPLSSSRKKTSLRSLRISMSLIRKLMNQKVSTFWNFRTMKILMQKK